MRMAGFLGTDSECDTPVIYDMGGMLGRTSNKTEKFIVADTRVYEHMLILQSVVAD